MKKLIPILLAAAAYLPGATVSCVLGQDISSGTATINCPGTAPTIGFEIISVQLQALGSWEDSTFGFTSNITFSFSENSAQFGASNLTGVASGTNSANTGLLSQFASSGLPLGMDVALDAFTVSATRTINSGGNPSGETVSFQYITTEQLVDGAVPEPATMAMFGAGLVVLGIFRKRR